ncbi:hypothetical protein [Janthinobacterium sp. 17J80-10]|uniref:hypothetical protein n=1 Tax=Janthinobacterium sp. 17J80-10 TaxID=2497863 RepID=UPI0010055BE0|nr:hypothetical protein [Janthinobacterium sp. 17J80-10]QAU34061.1 hypothetical protein EKL02_07590 [Janthinobacterium sp. 17J80-10]
MSNTIFELRDSVDVSTGRLGHVRMKQENYNQEVAIITVHPDDIPQLIEQLEKAGKEAQLIRAELNSRPSAKEAEKP